MWLGHKELVLETGPELFSRMHQSWVPLLSGRPSLRSSRKRPIDISSGTMSVTGSSACLSYLHVDVGPVVDQELQTERSVCGSCSKVQRSEALVVRLADVGAPVNQLAGDQVLAVKAGQVEGRVPKGVGFINLRSPWQHDNRVTASLSLCVCVCACIFTSTAKLSRCLITAICPLEAAVCRGVYPRLSLQLTSAPWFTNRRTTSKWPVGGHHTHTHKDQYNDKGKKKQHKLNDVWWICSWIKA